MELFDPLRIVGTTIGDKYEIERVVGEGGFGIVYRANHKIWQQPVAIKCFKVLMEVAPDMRESLLRDFIQEGALLSQLSGRTASIVQARDVGTFTTETGAWVPYMVLEWLEGQTLEAMLEADRARLGGAGDAAWPIEKVMTLLEPVAMALDVVHRRGIAHRDIKPANIFVLAAGTEEMHVKVLDFGIAKVVQSAADHSSFTKTRGAVTSFTPAYGAPEQFSRTQGATGPWTDVYALALVMTELLVGRAPLEGDDFIQLGMATSDPTRRPTPASFGVQVGELLEGALAKALAVKPQERFVAAGDFWQAVRSSQNAGPLRTTGGATSPKWGASSGLSAPTSGQAATTAAPGWASFAPTQLGGIDARSTAEVGGPTASGTGTPLSKAGSLPEPVASTRSTLVSPARTSGNRVLAGVLGAAVLAGLGGLLFARDRQGASSSSSTAASAGRLAPVATVSASAVALPPPVPTCAERMVRISGGKFFMGSDETDADSDERPAHQVTLSPYCIDAYEVTAAEYKACSDIGECKRAPFEVDWKDIRPAEKKAFSPVCNGNRPERGQHPINCVDWEMANTYCTSMHKRLPTEAEWEFAARGPDGRRYPWGDEQPDSTRLNACGKECIAWGAKNGVEMSMRGRGMYPDDDGFATTAPVGSFPEGKSRYGLFDVVGNVWEWTTDWDGKYAPAPAVDPSGPASGERKIVRGGAFNGVMASWVRPSQRYSDVPKTHSHAYGFRCAASL